jgi:uncharacterized protein YndB with AHSA1/START domain
METIERTIEVSATPEDSVSAVATQSGIAGWWSINSEIGVGVGAVASLTFHKDDAVIPMAFEITESSNDRVSWRCTENASPSWVGTVLSWNFTPVGDGTRVDFAHSNWGESGPAGEIGKGWDHFVTTSLKAYLDTGTGMPWE